MNKQWNKTDLENLIYAKAEQLNLPVRTQMGRLQIEGINPLMHHLVAIYNFFFEQENKLLLMEEVDCTQQEYIAFFVSYCRDKKKYPLANNLYLQKTNCGS